MVIIVEGGFDQNFGIVSWGSVLWKDYLSPTHGLTVSRHGFNAEEAELEGLHSTLKFIKRRITSFNCILMDSKLVADAVDSQLSKCLKD